MPILVDMYKYANQSGVGVTNRKMILKSLGECLVVTGWCLSTSLSSDMYHLFSQIYFFTKFRLIPTVLMSPV